MPIPGPIETAASALNLASALADFARQSRPNQRRVRPIIRALRGIYFTPRGTIKILAVLAEGATPDQDDIDDVLTDFNDREWHVARHLDRVDFGNTDDMNLSLRQRRTLTEIAWDKRNLRREIQDALNQSLTDGRKIDADQARLLLRRVETLNAVIESLEEELL